MTERDGTNLFCGREKKKENIDKMTFFVDKKKLIYVFDIS